MRAHSGHQTCCSFHGLHSAERILSVSVNEAMRAQVSPVSSLHYGSVSFCLLNMAHGRSAVVEWMLQFDTRVWIFSSFSS